MDLMELRKALAETESTITYLEFKDSMSQQDMDRVRELEAELKKLLNELKSKDYYYVFISDSCYPYLHRRNMVGSSPYPFLSEDEAMQALRAYEKECPEEIGKVAVKKHSKEKE